MIGRRISYASGRTSRVHINKCSRAETLGNTAIRGDREERLRSDDPLSTFAPYDPLWRVRCTFAERERCQTSRPIPCAASPISRRFSRDGDSSPNFPKASSLRGGYARGVCTTYVDTLTRINDHGGAMSNFDYGASFYKQNTQRSNTAANGRRAASAAERSQQRLTFKIQLRTFVACGRPSQPAPTAEL